VSLFFSLPQETPILLQHYLNLELNTDVFCRVMAVTINLIIFTASLGIWGASYCITAEVSSLRLRAKTQGLAWAFSAIFNFLLGFVIPYTYNPDEGNLRAKIGYVWAGVCGLTLLGIWYCVPETFRRTPMQLDLMFERKVGARGFKGWEEREGDLEMANK
jgi:hypothetical protein